jgi:hypothetical protein
LVSTTLTVGLTKKSSSSNSLFSSLWFMRRTGQFTCTLLTKPR